MSRLTIVIPILLLMSIACQKNTTQSNKEVNEMKQRIAQFAPTELKYDASLLNARQKQVLQKLYLAAKIIDDIYLDQVYAKNLQIRQTLQQATDPLEKLKYDYFKIMFGPFDRLEHDKLFYGTEAKPKGANFYPQDMSKEEFNTWIKNHPEDEKAFTSEFTVIRRKGDALVAIPYTEYYAKPLSKIIHLLHEAAEFADNPSLKKYLLSRAKAFETNDYFESDMNWMDLKDHAIEVIIGPYEVYEDEIFNYKASFECFLTIKDPEESAKLETIGQYLNKMEAHLPIPDAYKNFNRGSESPIMVVQEVFSAGDTKAGVQTLAFNLPNDERVREAKGSKKVMLKNMHEAKFDQLLKPISERVLDSDQKQLVSFNGFFNHTLMHEVSHGLGPGIITLNGRKTEVKKELKETYSKIEECKADVLGMYNNVYMIGQGFYPESLKKETWVTFLAGIFRSIRFGINEAHGAGNAIIFNFLLEKGGYEYNPETQTVRVNFDKIEQAITELAHTLLVIQAEGNYQGAQDLIAKYAVESAPIAAMRAKLTDLPVDIFPVFQIEENQ